MTTELEREVSEHHAYEPGPGEGGVDTPGWSLFAGTLMIGIGLFALMSAFAGWVNNSFIYDHSILGNALGSFWYGMFDGLIAIVAFIAGFAIWQGRKIGFWLGLILATLSAGRWFLFIPGVPIWALTMVGIWLLVVYGLIQDRKYFN